MNTQAISTCKMFKTADEAFAAMRRGEANGFEVVWHRDDIPSRVVAQARFWNTASVRGRGVYYTQVDGFGVKGSGIYAPLDGQPAPDGATTLEFIRRDVIRAIILGRKVGKQTEIRALHEESAAM